MRTTKRFTPAVLRRWEKNQRSEGTFASYRPWHQVTRDDPASYGQSRIMMSPLSGRQHAFLSKLEFHTYCCLTLMGNIADICEQFALATQASPHELCRYGALNCNGYDGTFDVAQRMGIKHPMLFAKEEKTPWRMTTDFLCLVEDKTTKSLLAISVKPSIENLSERSKQLLRIEREYWRARSVEWQLLTENCFSARVRLGLSFCKSWALNDQRVSETRLQRDAQTLQPFDCLTYAQAIDLINDGDDQRAKCSLMQAVWRGLLFIDFAALTGPEPLIKLISKREFDLQNPIKSGRFACL